MQCPEVEILDAKILQRSEASLIPVVEDVADWVSKFMKVDISPENFLSVLDDGVLICDLASSIQKASSAYCIGRACLGPSGVRTKLEPLPVLAFQCHRKASKGSFFARENCANFLKWCRKIGIQDSTLFEPEALVLHKQLKNVVLTLLELGRICASYEIDPIPSLVALEKEIEQAELDEFQNVTVRKRKGSKPCKEASVHAKDIDQEVQRLAAAHNVDVKRLKEGKYAVAGKTTMHVRMLRNHMMVRVGGGWDELGHYLSRHSPDKVGKILISTPAGRCH